MILTLTQLVIKEYVDFCRLKGLEFSIIAKSFGIADPLNKLNRWKTKFYYKDPPNPSVDQIRVKIEDLRVRLNFNWSDIAEDLDFQLRN